MSVKILMDEQKNTIYDMWKDGFTKTEIGRQFGVSARTVFRVIDEMEERLDLEDDEEEIITLDFCDDEGDDEFFWPEDEDGAPQFSEVVPTNTYTFVASKHMISIIRDLDGKGVSITRDTAGFEDSYSLIYEEGGSQDALDIVFKQHDTASKWEVYEYLGVKIDPEAGRVYYEKGNISVEFHGRLASRLISALTSGDESDLDNMVYFTLNLLQNPDESAVNGLYDFLEATDIEIVEDGMVRAWKKIRGDYTDVYTGQIDNSPGEYVSVPRHKVDPDPERTCSFGLHACAKSYLLSYPGERIVAVLIDPKDFVAIPKDYNFAKARVCAYHVEKEATSFMSQYI